MSERTIHPSKEDVTEKWYITYQIINEVGEEEPVVNYVAQKGLIRGKEDDTVILNAGMYLTMNPNDPNIIVGDQWKLFSKRYEIVADFDVDGNRRNDYFPRLKQ